LLKNHPARTADFRLPRRRQIVVFVSSREARLCSPFCFTSSIVSVDLHNLTSRCGIAVSACRVYLFADTQCFFTMRQDQTATFLLRRKITRFSVHLLGTYLAINAFNICQ